jgi:hypothetical protein
VDLAAAANGIRRSSWGQSAKCSDYSIISKVRCYQVL